MSVLEKKLKLEIWMINFLNIVYFCYEAGKKTIQLEFVVSFIKVG